MSNANKRGTLPPHIPFEIITKLQEIIEDLVKLNKLTIDTLAQYTSVSEYEDMMAGILNGNDVIIE